MTLVKIRLIKLFLIFKGRYLNDFNIFLNQFNDKMFLRTVSIFKFL